MFNLSNSTQALITRLNLLWVPTLLLAFCVIILNSAGMADGDGLPVIDILGIPVMIGLTLLIVQASRGAQLSHSYLDGVADGFEGILLFLAPIPLIFGVANMHTAGAVVAMICLVICTLSTFIPARLSE
ncbi:hypothetical protein ACEUZ9_004710 [Paracoccus litorisediminis]|uniref:hypothetical protein n=1 Tax=Paracoccus litorisediminis TaxID=2006130 RepID=UPI003731514F